MWPFERSQVREATVGPGAPGLERAPNECDARARISRLEPGSQIARHLEGPRERPLLRGLARPRVFPAKCLRDDRIWTNLGAEDVRCDPGYGGGFLVDRPLASHGGGGTHTDGRTFRVGKRCAVQRVRGLESGVSRVGRPSARVARGLRPGLGGRIDARGGNAIQQTEGQYQQEQSVRRDILVATGGLEPPTSAL